MKKIIATIFIIIFILTTAAEKKNKTNENYYAYKVMYDGLAITGYSDAGPRYQAK